MKISCQSCGAKYNIADDKVRGKIVKIACKKCGARIEIDGRDQAAARVSDVGAADASAAQTTDGGAMWTVSVDDNDQRDVSTPQLLELIRVGTVTPDTYVWRDGMTDWLTVRDVPELAIGASEPAVSPAAPASPSAPAVALFPDPGAAAREASSAARLGAGRRGGAVDLFAAPGTAPVEDEDVATSAPQPGLGFAMAASGGGGGKPIGARNENSVLFSLAALTASGPSTASLAPADDEKSGLIDIQKLAASAKPGAGDNRAKLDDIMNLGGGGAFGASLGAPILAPPSDAAYAPPPNEEGGKKKGAWLLIGLIGIGLVLIALLLVLVFRGKGDDVTARSGKGSDKAEKPDKTAVDDKGDEKGSPSKDGTESDKGSADKTPDKGSSAAPGPSTSAPSGKVATGGGPAPTAAAAAAGPGPAAAAKDPATPKSDPTPPASGGAKPCKSLDDCIGGGAAPAKPTATAAPPAGGEIDKGAAKSALSGVSYKDCGGGGAGNVTVTFGPNGNVVGASVSGDYDASTKSCVSRRFMGAKVPAYGGAAKAFNWKISL